MSIRLLVQDVVMYSGLMNTTGTTLTAPAITPTNRDGVYLAQGSNGATYLCSPVGAGWCYCPAAQYARDGRPCKHVERARHYVADTLRARAAAMGIRVLAGRSEAEPVGADAPAGDLYGPAEEEGE
jgi:hypothetical protein